MNSKTFTIAHHCAGWFALACGSSFALLVGIGYMTNGSSQFTHPVIADIPEIMEESPYEKDASIEHMQRMVARLLPEHMRGGMEWVVLSPLDMVRGRSIPPGRNTIFMIPDNIESIPRRTLLGRSGDYTRYWGYCFPKDQEQAEEFKRRGIPGEMFFSEKEREFILYNEDMEARNSFTTVRRTSKKEQGNTEKMQKFFLNQKDEFLGGDRCYIMTDGPIKIGLDSDDDGVNIQLETELGTLSDNSDTDDDGVKDGREIFGYGSNPTVRDSDGDGLIDGLEDQNGNGRVDDDETSPIKWDTDGDTLCDGLCKINNDKLVIGEDRNLNGIVDEGETDPLVQDTDDNGVRDDQEYYLCQLLGGSDC